MVLDAAGGTARDRLGGGGLPAQRTDTLFPPQGGDHPRSKVYQAKQVLKQIVTDNQDKVSFMFAQYDQNTDVLMQNGAASTLAAGRANRFQYWTSTERSPSMATTELGIMNDVGSTAGRGLQSWQLIFPPRAPLSGWNAMPSKHAPYVSPPISIEISHLV